MIKEGVADLVERLSVICHWQQQIRRYYAGKEADYTDYPNTIEAFK